MALDNDAIYVQEGRFIEITAAGNQARGDVVVMGGLVGIASKDAVTGSTEQVIDVEGVYEVKKGNAVAFAVGDPVFWNGTAADAVTSGTPLGLCIVPAAGAATRVRVKLIPTIPASL